MSVPSLSLQGAFLYELSGEYGIFAGLLNTVEQAGRLCVVIQHHARVRRFVSTEELAPSDHMTPVMIGWFGSLPDTSLVEWVRLDPPIVIPANRLLSTRLMYSDHPLYPEILRSAEEARVNALLSSEASMLPLL